MTSTLPELADRVSASAGVIVDEAWLAERLAEVMVQVRTAAPCKREEWLLFTDLPDDILTVVVAALARRALNPQGYRGETIGEYSYQMAGPMSDFTDLEHQTIAQISGCIDASGSSTYSITVESSLPLVLYDADYAAGQP